MKRGYKRINNKTRPPLWDSTIELGPGEKVMIDKRLAQDWTEQQESLKNIRGKVLAVCIQIELTLDSLLRHLFYPEKFLKLSKKKTRDFSDLSSLFLYEVVKELRFTEKLRILKQVSTQHVLLRNQSPYLLLKRLEGVRKARNIFAHSAISFIPKGFPPNQNLIPEAYSNSKRVILDKEYFKECERLFSETLGLLNSLEKKIVVSR